MGFDQDNFNEAPLAKLIANHCGTVHREIYLNPKALPGLIERILNIWSEPFGDTSAIPTAILSEFASKKVKVVFSADGGDELFAGYNKYSSMNKKLRLNKIIGRMPNIAKYSNFIEKSKKTPFYLREFQTINKIQNILNLMGKDRLDLIVSSSINNSLWKQKFPKNYENSQNIDPISDFVSDIDLMLYLDSKNYLPNNVLCKVDRATMAFGLEGRDPLLDFRLVEFAASCQAPLR